MGFHGYDEDSVIGNDIPLAKRLEEMDSAVDKIYVDSVRNVAQRSNGKSICT